MSYTLREPTGNLANTDNILTLLKFYGVNIVVSIVVGLIIALIMYTIELNVFSMILTVCLVFVSHLYAITSFEYFDGCYRKVESNPETK